MHETRVLTKKLLQEEVLVMDFVLNNTQHSLETYNKQLLDEVEHDVMNYQNRGLCYLPKPKAEPDNTDTRF